MAPKKTTINYYTVSGTDYFKFHVDNKSTLGNKTTLFTDVRVDLEKNPLPILKKLASGFLNIPKSNSMKKAEILNACKSRIVFKKSSAKRSRKAARKSRKAVRKSRKVARKSRKAARKSRKAARKSRKAARKSKRKSRKVARKSRKVARKSRKVARKAKRKSRKVARKSKRKSKKVSK